MLAAVVLLLPSFVVMYTSTVYCVSGVRLDMRHSKLLSSVSLQSAGALSELLIRRRSVISCLQASSSCCLELLTVVEPII